MMPELIGMTEEEMHAACDALYQLVRVVPAIIQTSEESP